MKMRISAVLAVVVIALSLAGCSGSSAAGGGGQSGSAANFAFNIDTTDLSGNAVTTGDLEGHRLVMLNIWATWCPPCVAELPELQQISQAYADKGVLLVGVLQDGVSDNGTREEGVIADAVALMEEAGANYTVILPDKTIKLEFITGMQYFPTTFFLDEKGTLVETVIGAKDYKDWSSTIDEILEKLA